MTPVTESTSEFVMSRSICDSSTKIQSRFINISTRIIYLSYFLFLFHMMRKISNCFVVLVVFCRHRCYYLFGCSFCFLLSIFFHRIIGWCWLGTVRIFLLLSCLIIIVLITVSANDNAALLNYPPLHWCSSCFTVTIQAWVYVNAHAELSKIFSHLLL